MLEKTQSTRGKGFFLKVSRFVTSASEYIAARPVMFAFLALHVGFATIYTIVFQVTRLEPFYASLQGTLINTIPLAALSALWRQGVAHPILAILFTFLWYFVVIVGQGYNGNWLEDGFTIRPFGWIAGVWQLYQGIALYGMAAMFAYAAYFYRRMKNAEFISSGSEISQSPLTERPDNLLIKSGAEYLSVSHRDMVYLEANGDQVRLHCTTRTLTTSKSLASLEAVLPTPPFIRVHRSYIVSTERVLSAEPAGNGRLTIHLSNGRSVVTSRSGAQAFRTRVD
mgnify:CR=1 FL=1